MTKLSQRIAALRHNFRQFEHGGHCFGSEEMSAIVRELGAIRDAALTLEQDMTGAKVRQALPRKEISLGTLVFVPSAGPRLEH